MPIRIVIADDHQILRAGLRRLLEADPNMEVVGEATNGEEAVRQSEILLPDLVLMDINMPGMNGLEATKVIFEFSHKIKVLILSMHEDVELLQACIRVGASGYIIKRAAESELIDAIYAAMRGMIYIHPSLIGPLVTPAARHNTPVAASVEPLSVREEEILNFIVKGYTNRQIAQELNLSVRTVETHRSNLMDKLDLHSRVDLVRYATARSGQKNNPDP